MSRREKYQGWSPAPTTGGVCSKHETRLMPVTRVCLDCHHEALEAARFDWRAIGCMRQMGGGAGGWRVRHEEQAA